MQNDDERFERPYSSEYLFVLPPVACIAYAIRCARRLQPALIEAAHPACATVAQLLQMLDEVCAGGRGYDDSMEQLFRSLGFVDEQEGYYSAAETAIVAARWAAQAAKFPDTAVGPTHFAAEQTYLTSAQYAQASWDDFRQLRDAVWRGEITTGSNIEPSFFAPHHERGSGGAE
jgi:hypothetical protein